MNNSHLAQARIVAATMTLLSRELKEIGPPFSLWQPYISESFIRSQALSVAHGESVPLWVDARHPGRGFLLYRHDKWESEFLGRPSARLEGPFMVVEEDADRRERSGFLAWRAQEKARAEGHAFLALKCLHDPAFLNGFLSKNFIIAEIGSSLYIDVEADLSSKAAPAGFAFLDEFDETEKLARSLGDFFYDGRHRNDPAIGLEKSAKLWAQIAADDLGGQADPALVLWDIRRDRAAGLATCRPMGGESAGLSILALTRPYWGEGLSRHLLAEILARLSQKGLKRLFIETSSYNLPALKRYQSLGAKPCPGRVALHWHM